MSIPPPINVPLDETPSDRYLPWPCGVCGDARRVLLFEFRFLAADGGEESSGRWRLCVACREKLIGALRGQRSGEDRT